MAGKYPTRPPLRSHPISIFGQELGCLIIENLSVRMRQWSPTGKARGTSIEIPSYAKATEVKRLRRVIHRWRNPPKHQVLSTWIIWLPSTHSSTGRARALLRRWIKRVLDWQNKLLENRKPKRGRSKIVFIYQLFLMKPRTVPKLEPSPSSPAWQFL